uniref:Uncharacterized protein n=1 Tax=Arundo donax TaxID=35708 RepID=A0A0A8YFW1_ARUDO
MLLCFISVDPMEPQPPVPAHLFVSSTSVGSHAPAPKTKSHLPLHTSPGWEGPRKVHTGDGHPAASDRDRTAVPYPIIGPVQAVCLTALVFSDITGPYVCCKVSISP